MAARSFPATYSIPDADLLAKEVDSRYDLSAGPATCRLLHRGLNETYEVRSGRRRWVLRVYRARWRSDDEVAYELDALEHLTARGVPVASPVRAASGHTMWSIAAPEGRRQAALFTYAPGATPPLSGFTEDYFERHGTLTARVHEATTDFSSRHGRFDLGIDHLVDRPVAAMLPVLPAAEDRKYVRSLAARLRRELRSFDSLDWGFCHGDVHGWNTHVQNGELTFFDFDCCGAGWRAYDNAVIRWSSARFGGAQASARWRAFLRGYRSVRRFGRAEEAATRWFVAARHLWLIGLHVGGARDWGAGQFDNNYFNTQVGFLRTWEKRHLDR